MAIESRRCPKCSGTLEQGYVADMGYGQVHQSAWSPGEPEIRRFVGGIRVKASEQIPLAAFRCGTCGFVEFYAPTPGQ